MQILYKPNQYPKALRTKLNLMPELAIEIANRWALGWPKMVKALVESGEYLAALERQEQTERDVLTRPGNNHLARHEIIQEYGLSMMPPEASQTSPSMPSPSASVGTTQENFIGSNIHD